MHPQPANGAAGPLQAAVAALAAAGGDRFHPARFRYLQSMADRAAQADPAVAEILLEKALAALRRYQSELSAAQADAAALATQLCAAQPDSAPRVQALLEGGDFRALRRLQRRQRDNSSALAELTALLDRAASTAGEEAGAGVELRAARYFRDARLRHHADTLVSGAERDLPTDAGPLNPQKLAVRSLLAMRELSPRYLARFVSYVDTLFWLEQAGAGRKP